MQLTDLEAIELTVDPKDVDLGRAWNFYHATRLLARYEITREKAAKYRAKAMKLQAGSTLQAQVSAPTTPPQRTRSGLPVGDAETCLMGAVMGGRKNRELKVCSDEVFNEGLARYKQLNRH